VAPPFPDRARIGKASDDINDLPDIDGKALDDSDMEERRMAQAVTEVLAAVPVEPLEDLATPAEPAAAVVVPSDSSDDEQDPVKKKFRAKKKNPTPYVQPLFQRARSGNTAAMA
jgi:hypothetical protein